MDTPATPDSNNARAANQDATGQEPDVDDNSVLHADQLTADDDATEKRPTPPAAKRLLAVVAAVVVAIGGFTLFQTFGQPLEESVRQAPDVASTSVQAPGGTAEVEVSNSRNAAVVTFKNLTAPGRNEVYQVWTIPADGSAPVSAGMLTEENISGAKPLVIENISGNKEAAVTLEPRGGSQSPTPPFAVSISLKD
jgi:anti-sigma-K factor RskA